VSPDRTSSMRKLFQVKLIEFQGERGASPMPRLPEGMERAACHTLVPFPPVRRIDWESRSGLNPAIASEEMSRTPPSLEALCSYQNPWRLPSAAWRN
jgi:hypothetical protein